jgi:hypothetical protein
MNSEAKLDSLIQQADAKMQQFKQDVGQPEAPVSEENNQPIMETKKKTYKMSPYHFQLMIQEAAESADKKIMEVFGGDVPVVESKGVKRYMVTEAQLNRIHESAGMMDEISRQSHPEAIEQMNDYLRRGQAASIVFVKMQDNALRIANGKIIPKAAKESIQGNRNIDRERTNTYLYWDNNAPNKKDPSKSGDYRSFNLDTIMLFKGGNLLIDFTKVNEGAFNRLSPESQQKLLIKLEGFKETSMGEPIVV